MATPAYRPAPIVAEVKGEMVDAPANEALALPTVELNALATPHVMAKVKIVKAKTVKLDLECTYEYTWSSSSGKPAPSHDLMATPLKFHPLTPKKLR